MTAPERGPPLDTTPGRTRVSGAQMSRQVLVYVSVTWVVGCLGMPRPPNSLPANGLRTRSLARLVDHSIAYERSPTSLPRDTRLFL